METHFGLSDLLAGLADFGVPHDVKSGQKAIKCNICGFTFADFQKVGRLGCPACYDAFGTQLSTLLKRIHGSDVYMGKIPVMHTNGKPVPRESNELQDLKIKLQKAIADEAFEEAASLRDKIRDIENRLKKG
jgi:protein arginine kinase activator